jgi:HTH-type transcriptional regulator / antitoxin HipB
MAANTDTSLRDLARQQRQLSGLSQADLARLAGVGKTVVFDLEHGKRSIRFDTLIKILAVLNIHISFVAPPVHSRPIELRDSGRKNKVFNG